VTTGPAPSTALVLLNRPSAAAAPHDPNGPALRVVDPARAHLLVTDLGVTRGDGVFETLGIVDSRVRGMDAHLLRFMRSARVLDLPAPDEQLWREAIRLAAGTIAPQPSGFVRAVLTRGVEGDGRPTGWAYAAAQPDYSAVRVTGVRVVLLDRGTRHDVDVTAPWLLGGAKTLSYALNRAAVREAHRRNADDVVFVSSDGYLLEGPTSSLILLRDGVMCTPPAGFGILAGTTQASIFRWAASAGLATDYRLLVPDELRSSDAAWLVSSGRGAVPIHEIDGITHRVDDHITAELNANLAGL
jgi:4-amino-4-deoxychorismate lyase